MALNSLLCADVPLRNCSLTRNCPFHCRTWCRHLAVQAKYSIRLKIKWRSIPQLQWRRHVVTGLTTSLIIAHSVWWVFVCMLIRVTVSCRIERMLGFVFCAWFRLVQSRAVMFWWQCCSVNLVMSMVVNGHAVVTLKSIIWNRCLVTQNGCCTITLKWFCHLLVHWWKDIHCYHTKNPK